MTNSNVEIACRPLTPVWTGDIHRKGAQLRETGLLGSLRWWYEAMLRGFGFYACDPSSRAACVYGEPSKIDGICQACQFFGCTGYSRRFRFEVDGGGEAGPLMEVRLRNPGNARHLGWRVPQRLMPEFRMKFSQLFAAGFDSKGLALVLRLIERFGALGAKASHGQGVVRFSNAPVTPTVSDWKASMTRVHKQSVQPPGAPNLDEMVGVMIELAPQTRNWWNNIPLDIDAGFRLSDKSTWIPSAPGVRAMLRAELRSFPVAQRHRLMGTIQGSPKGSDIFVTHLYRELDRWRMCIFGFVPKDGTLADQHTRRLLSGAGVDELKTKLAGALGLRKENIALVTPYPNRIEDFFV